MSIDLNFRRERFEGLITDVVKFHIWCTDKEAVCSILNAFPAVCNNYTLEKSNINYFEIVIPVMYAEYAGFAGLLRRLYELQGG